MIKFFKYILGIILIIIGIILYARFIGTMGFDTKEYTIYDSQLPNGFDGIKIVHFSDIHYNRAINKNKIEKIVEEINLIKADIVVFTGDLIDKDMNITNDDYNYLTKAFKKINAKYGKFAILGNHDYQEMEQIKQVFNESDFKYLENNYEIIYNEKNEKIFIGGIGNVSYGLDDVDKTMEYFNSNNDIDYKILLVHEPDISNEIIDNYNVNLILAGHSHNGQIRLPIIGAIYTPPGAKNYYDEHYIIDGTNLYISSGIGVCTVNYRLWNRPSINFYRLNKEKEVLN